MKVGEKSPSLTAIAEGVPADDPQKTFERHMGHVYSSRPVSEFTRNSDPDETVVDDESHTVLIGESTSNWGSPIIFVCKRNPVIDTYQ